MTDPTDQAPPHGIALWWAGARPRTLGAAVTPVVIGVAIAHRSQSAGRGASDLLLPGLACLLVALALQVGVNYANDYYDGVRGIDKARVGPLRLTASGLVPPRRVLAAALGCFTVAGALGALVAFRVDARLLIVGVAAIAAALAYSGGPRPYAGLGLGEVMVLLFFGVVPVAGTAFVALRWTTPRCPSFACSSAALPLPTIPQAAWWMGAAAGCFAVAILLANNIRDIASDTAAGKRTLPVRIGDTSSRLLYRIAVLLPFLLLALALAIRILPVLAAIAFAAALITLRPLRDIRDARGPALVPVLIRTGYAEVAFGALFAAAIFIAR